MLWPIAFPLDPNCTLTCWFCLCPWVNWVWPVWIWGICWLNWGNCVWTIGDATFCTLCCCEDTWIDWIVIYPGPPAPPYLHELACPETLLFIDCCIPACEFGGKDCWTGKLFMFCCPWFWVIWLKFCCKVPDCVKLTFCWLDWLEVLLFCNWTYIACCFPAFCVSLVKLCEGPTFFWGIFTTFFYWLI